MTDAGALIPITILTGYLGSGKTTILNAYLATPNVPPTAVVINEFGDIGLDHLLVQKTTENLVLLENGCICCTVRDDLRATLVRLVEQSKQGEIPAFSRVIIETTGLADPVPIIHTLMNDLSLMLHYSIAQVLVTVDAVTGNGTLDRFAEGRKQAAFADRVLLTKSELCSSAGDLNGLKQRLFQLNPGMILTDKADMPTLASIFEADLFNPRAKVAVIDTWLQVEHCQGQHDHHHHHHDHDGPCDDSCVTFHQHDDHIRAFCILRDRPLPWSLVSSWLDRLIAKFGTDMLRVKGILNIAESPGRPLVVHGVQHLFHPPETLDRWPSDDHRSRVVFITHDIEMSVVAEALQDIEARHLLAGQAAGISESRTAG